MRRATRIAALVLVTYPLACGERASPHGAPDGVYAGEATYRGARLALGVDFRSEGDSLRAYLDSPGMMILGKPLESVRFERPRVRFTTPDDHPVLFEGVVAGDSIVGTAVVHVWDTIPEGDTARVRFTLRRAIVPPPPYATRNVTFQNGEVRLGGTVYLPPGMPHTLPGVVILQGSTANLRHEYRFYADHFARAGFAVMTFDKRGHGESSGDYRAASYDDLAADAAAALAALRAEPEVARSRVGLWGLSQGAFIAPMVAARSESLAFVVAVSAPGLSTGACAAYQDSVRLRSAGFSVADAESAAALDRLLLEWVRTGRHPYGFEAHLARVADTAWRRASSIPRSLPRPPALDGWYWRGRALDPLPAWRGLHVPALVVFGVADELLPAAASAANIEKALGEARNRDHTVKSFPAANHMLLTLPRTAGGAWEWDWPRAAPGYLELVTDWMRAHARP